MSKTISLVAFLVAVAVFVDAKPRRNQVDFKHRDWEIEDGPWFNYQFGFMTANCNGRCGINEVCKKPFKWSDRFQCVSIEND